MSEESERGKYDITYPRPSIPMGNFLAQNKLLWESGTYFPGFTAAQGVRAYSAILNSQFNSLLAEICGGHLGYAK